MGYLLLRLIFSAFFPFGRTETKNNRRNGGQCFTKYCVFLFLLDTLFSKGRKTTKKIILNLACKCNREEYYSRIFSGSSLVNSVVINTKPNGKRFLISYNLALREDMIFFLYYYCGCKFQPGAFSVHLENSTSPSISNIKIRKDFKPPKSSDPHPSLGYSIEVILHVFIYPTAS